MFIDTHFSAKIAYLDLALLDRTADTVCIVDAELILRAFNPAWVSFSQANGAPDLTSRFGLGTPLAAAIPEVLRDFYGHHYHEALRKRVRFEHDYDCSSDGEHRIFRQTAYALADRSGLVITHHLTVSCPVTEQTAVSAGDFKGAGGSVVQCVNCRKVRNPEAPERWLWVPKLVSTPDPDTSHSLCPYCLDFYYPDLGD